MRIKSVALTGAAALAFVVPGQAVLAQAASKTAPAAKPAPVSALVKAVDIPYQTFTLKNGLRVVVHTDRKAPVVAVSVWYDVGSKHEPKGKTGFAHLFEHLMFNGSENAPGDFFAPLKSVGATDYNGTTHFDRTNYFETVPTAALDRALFLESDRMGYLLGAVTQGVLDEQRGVVQNEKRQGDNQPYGLTQYKILSGLFPEGHPYAHSTIGSMADLDQASLETVKDWFRSHYGPNNAVLVLAGDIDVATAKPLVEKYFGAIQPGPKSVLPTVTIPTLPAPVNEVMKDRVAAVMISRNWAVPGLNDPETASLVVAGSVLGGLASSRLDNILVKQEKLAVQVSAGDRPFSQVGMFNMTAIVRPGVDPALVDKRMGEILADFLKNGPTADEVQRAVTRFVSGRVQGLESVGGFGGKAVALAEGALYSNDPGKYKKQLEGIAAQTPATVKAAANKWLSRPAYTLTVVPGARDAYEEAKVPPRADVPAAPDQAPKGTRGGLPDVGQVKPLSFPAVQRSRLANGIELIYAQRTAVPVTQIATSFDAGIAADVPGKLGTQRMVQAMLDEGTTHRNTIAIAEEQERLGATIGSSASNDRTVVGLDVPSINLAPALDLYADILRNPAFPDPELARVKAQTLAGIKQELTSPQGLASRVLPPLVYGPTSPYAKAQGAGDPAAVAAMTRDQLVAFQQAWLRPDKAKIFVTSDRPLAEVKAALDRVFGDWKGTGTAGVKSFTAGQPSAPKIVLVNRPDSPQSMILAGAPTALKGVDDLLLQNTANDALGGSFLSRINTDIRENKHWSYGVRGGFQTSEFAAPYIMSAPVQADKTGPSIDALRTDVTEFLTTKPMDRVEYDRAITGAIRSLSGNFETSGAVLSAMQTNDLYRRPDNYYATITQRYQAMTLPELNKSIQAAFNPKSFVWVVVGDAKTVKPQLDTLGLPVEVIEPAAVVAPAPAAQ
ncbi:M16 family metallopeptidase [Sphingomonas parapaucimobilis]|uniref:M16 family metallopeptidase n=1 Tax=Sphingomonas parapaucimobilis TaxID=28213 RepID=UPI0035C858AA